MNEIVTKALELSGYKNPELLVEVIHLLSDQIIDKEGAFRYLLGINEIFIGEDMVEENEL